MSNDKKSIKEWAADDRPREKMMLKGKASLSDAELVAILIGSGNSRQSAVELSRDILASVGNDLISLSDLTLNELMQHNGIGEAKAVSIMAALELGRRRRSAEVRQKDTLGDSKESYERLLPYIDDMRQEQFIVMYLNQKHAILKIERVSNGSVTHALADPKVIFRNAISIGATSIVMAHNHPSGIPSPSNDDTMLTKKFIAAGNLLDIKVIDHIIIGEGRYYSFLDNGKMDF